jgi:hypothetical protein
MKRNDKRISYDVQPSFSMFSPLRLDTEPSLLCLFSVTTMLFGGRDFTEILQIEHRQVRDRCSDRKDIDEGPERKALSVSLGHSFGLTADTT